MLIFTNIQNKGLLQKLKNYCNNFLHSLENFLGKSFFVPFFYLFSHNTTNPAHKRVAKKKIRVEFSRATYVNTKSNCIHVLCKNNWHNFSLAGRYVA